MTASRKNITLGTAGHIDHGKTALIKCLTGCDTDTLKAEKERGMSIDLGFAPCTVSELEVGIVDVPGHENFIKTMVAGATGIDGVIFVIAADDGVMPQTREHLDILTLLGVKHGIVALTKVDIVGTSRVDNVTSEIREFLTGTFLDNAPILPVSGITGQGFDVFYEALKELVGSIEPKRIDGVFRLPVERTFSVKGYGTVVSGIPVSGSIKISDEVILFPQGTKGRIKTIQVYKRSSDIAMVGQCAALNVPQWDYKNIGRGCTVTIGGFFSPQQWYLCGLQVLSHLKSPIKNGAKLKFHTGTSEIGATVYLLEGSDVPAGAESIVQVRLNGPIVAAPRDRFILRSLSPADTIGGGMIIEAIPNRLKRHHPEVIRDVQNRAKAVLDDRDFVEYCIKADKCYAVSENDISIRTKIRPALLKDIIDELVRQDKIVILDSRLFTHKETADYVKKSLLDIVGEFHQSRPESPGIALEQFYNTSGLKKDVFDSFLRLLISDGGIVERKHCLALAEHREKFSSDEQKLLCKIELLFKERPFDPPNFDEVIEFARITQENLKNILNILIEQEKLVRVDKDMFFHIEAVERARGILISYITENGGLESVKFKYLLDTTRKFAIPLLDYFDRIGVTRRVGYTRYLRTSKPAG